MDREWLLAAAEALAAPTGVAVLFTIAMRAVLRADKTERAALAQIEREEREKGWGRAAGATAPASPAPESATDGAGRPAPPPVDSD